MAYISITLNEHETESIHLNFGARPQQELLLRRQGGQGHISEH